MFKGLTRFALLTVVALSFAACKNKEKVDDKNNMNGAGNSAPGIENTPMNFDANGSDSGKIAGLETIFFEYDKATLTSETKKLIASNADWMKARPNVNIQIEGHCDARGSIEYNLSLGERRARTVKEYMVSLGITDARISIISYGKEKPLQNGDNDEAYGKNRRANFVPLAQ